MDHPEEIAAEQTELSFPGSGLRMAAVAGAFTFCRGPVTVGNLLCGYYAIIAVLTGGEAHLDFLPRRSHRGRYLFSTRLTVFVCAASPARTANSGSSWILWRM